MHFLPEKQSSLLLDEGNIKIAFFETTKVYATMD